MPVFSHQPWTAAAIAIVLSSAVNAGQQTMETTIVSGTRSAQPSVAVPASIHVIDADAIRHSGVTTVAEALAMGPGIQINDAIGDGRRGATVSLRGFGENATNNVLVMVDGRKLNNPTLAGPDLSAIALKDVERIEIINGSAGILYGDKATGGVINIITRKAEDTRVRMEAGRGTDDWERYAAGFSARLDNGLGLRLSGEKRLADNYRDNNEADYGNVFAYAEYSRGSFLGFVEGQKIEDDLRLPGSLTATQIAEDRRQTAFPDDFSDRDTDVYRLGTAVDLGRHWQLLAEYSYRDSNGTVHLFSPFTESTRLQAATPRLVGKLPFAAGELLITAGADLQDSEHKTTALGGSHYEQELDAWYGQAIVPLPGQIKLTAGLRHSEIEDRDLSSSEEREDDELLTQVGIEWQPADGQRLFLRRDENLRWAVADENSYTLPTVDFLEPQRGESLEAGYEWQNDSYGFSALIYQLDLEDEILFDPSANMGFGANINLDDSEREGVTLTAHWQPLSALRISASASAVDAEIASGNFAGNDVPFVAERSGNFAITWLPLDSLTVYADAQYTGPRYRAGDDGNALPQLGGYTVFNANLRWQLDRYYANLRVSNLGDKAYNGYSGAFFFGTMAFDYAYPAPERRVFLTLGAEF